ncbi:MAG: peroxiredoxin [Treponema sp.]|nr:MAG: peroxiredoxin [Treponema sp.]
MEQEIYRMPNLGDAFPKLSVKTTQGNMDLPEDYKGTWWILFSHPADFTPVCTTEFVGFQKKMEEFEKIGVKLIGMSIDQVQSHIKWIEWIKEKLGVDITFPVIAANDDIANRLGILHPGKGTNTVRSVFVIDPQGLVRLTLTYPQEIGRNMDEILRATKALQLSDSKQIATPANWPNNDILEDKVIIPPAGTVADAKKRLDEYEGFDWWFCYKKLD